MTVIKANPMFTTRKHKSTHLLITSSPLWLHWRVNTACVYVFVCVCAAWIDYLRVVLHRYVNCIWDITQIKKKSKRKAEVVKIMSKGHLTWPCTCSWHDTWSCLYEFCITAAWLLHSQDQLYGRTSIFIYEMVQRYCKINPTKKHRNMCSHDLQEKDDLYVVNSKDKYVTVTNIIYNQSYITQKEKSKISAKHNHYNKYCACKLQLSGLNLEIKLN